MPKTQGSTVQGREISRGHRANWRGSISLDTGSELEFIV